MSERERERERGGNMRPTSASVVLIISLLNIRNVQSGTERVVALKIGSKYKVLNEKIKMLCGRSV